MALRILRLPLLLALLSVILPGSLSPALALDEADRLWLVGEQAFRDKLYPLSSRTLERFIDRFPGDKRLPEATLLLGKARLSQGALEAALETFRRALAFSPAPGKPDEARFWEGETLFRLKRFQEARALFDRILAEDAASPMAPDALYSFGWTELELKRRDSAAGAFRQLIEAFPDHANTPPATVYLARILVERKDFHDAVLLLQPFPSRHPEHRLLPDARYLLGYARVSSGQTAEGVSDLKSFLSASPGHTLAPQARRLVMDTLLRQGKKTELAEEYKTLMAQSPPSPEGFYDAGVIASRLGRQREADQAWTALRRDFPEHPLATRASLELAQGAFDRNNFKDAITLARGATKSEDAATRAQAHLVVGESELRLKRFPAAHEAFKAAVQLATNDPGTRFRALAGSGLALEEQRQWAQAIKYYEEVAEKSPDQTLQSWAKTRRAEMTAKLKAGKAAPGSGAGAGSTSSAGSSSSAGATKKGQTETRKP